MSWRIPTAFEARWRGAKRAPASVSMGISERLSACGDLVPAGTHVADIGADHGLLADALLDSGRASFVSAIDLSPQALKGAAARLDRWARRGLAETVCGDGLTALGGRADRGAAVACAIVAGTGAGTAIGIAQGAAAAGLFPARWIIQPAGGLGDVREALVDLGYGVAAERIIAEDRRLFGLVAFDLASGIRQLSSDVDVVVGPLLRRDPSWEVAAWLDVQEDWLAGKLRCATAPGVRESIARDLQAVREARASHSSCAKPCVSPNSPRP